MCPRRSQTWRLALWLALWAVTCAWGSVSRADAHVLLVHLHPPVDPRQAALSAPPARQDSGGSAQRAQLREHVHAVLSAQVQEAQRSITRVLQASSAEYGLQQAMSISPLWLQNTLIVRMADNELDPSRLMSFRDQLRWFPGILDVEEDYSALQLIGFEQGEYVGEREAEGETAQSNIQLLHAPELWTRGARGDGVVVANIDSGVRYTHEALKDTFRGSKADGSVDFDYSFWFTPGTDMSKETPDTADLVGHGTHTMGTAAGSKGIGVAPRATWITARAFDIWGAANKSDFLLAAQWVLCPTRLDGSDANCSLGADVVTNSFGVDRSTAAYPQWKWLSSVIDTWRAAGVYPVFAAGNTNGFLCGSVYYPGSRADTIAVGALMGGSSLWGASGKGPSPVDGSDCILASAMGAGSVKFVIKPDFVAPGVGIRSALSIKDDSYTRLTGTSMATPHVAGAIALLLSLHSSVSGRNASPPMEKVLKSLAETTARDLHKPFLVPSECGNTTYKQYPNNIYGWGLVDVCLAAQHLGFQCHDSAIAAGERLSIAMDDFVATE